MRRRLVISCIAAIAATVLASSAEACALGSPTDPAFALRADVVVSGRVKNYQRGEDRYKPFSVSVTRVLSGDPDRRITVAWERSTNINVPEALDGDYVFVLMKNDEPPSWNGPADYIILQGVCSGAFVFPKGSGSANEIRELFGLSPELPQGSSDIHWFQVLPYGVAFLGSIGIGVVLLWPRQKRPRR